MKLYSTQIVTQLINKVPIIMQICAEIIFGKLNNPSGFLFQYIRDNKTFYYRPFLDSPMATISIFPYKNKKVRELIWQIKFKNRKKHAVIVGEIISDILIDLLQEITPIYNFTLPILCIVPSHPSTIRKRKYTVPDLFARSALKNGLSEWVNYNPNLIRKIKKIPAQSRIKNREQRLENPRGSFCIHKTELIYGQNIILLDDVHTTGATIDEITSLLLQAGAKRVLRITLAH